MGSHVINISLPNNDYGVYYTDFCGKRYFPYLTRKEIVLSVSEKEADRFGKFVKKTEDGGYLFPIKIIDRTKIKCRLKDRILYENTPDLGYLLDNKLDITKANLCVDLFTTYARGCKEERLLTWAYLISMDAEVELKSDPLEEKYKNYERGGHMRKRKEYIKQNPDVDYAKKIALGKIHVLSGEEFHKLRLQYGISCQDIADVSKISKQTVSRYGQAYHKEPTEIYLTMVLEQIISYLPKKEG